MKSYSEDLRRKIVAAVERGMSKTEAARLFDVSLSSVKRYDRMARQGNSLAPKKRPDRKSTRLNSSHANISYAVFCLTKHKRERAHDARPGTPTEPEPSNA